MELRALIGTFSTSSERNAAYSNVFKDKNNTMKTLFVLLHCFKNINKNTIRYSAANTNAVLLRHRCNKHAT
jgi:hypothetical protein